jgi:hypothetical protein
MKNLKTKLYALLARSRAALANNKGEGFIDFGLKILISIVLGTLLLGGLYALFGETILPTLASKIEKLFDYAG